MTFTELQKFIFGKFALLQTKAEMGNLTLNDLAPIEKEVSNYFQQQNALQGVVKTNLDKNLKDFSKAKTASFYNDYQNLKDKTTENIKSLSTKYYDTWLKTEAELIDKNTMMYKQHMNNLKRLDNNEKYSYVWITAGDEKVRDLHRSFNGLTLPITDTFWNNYFPGTDINCYDKETRVYTNNGLKYFKDLDLNDEILSLNPETLETEYLKPINYIKKYENNILSYKSKTLSIFATKNHQMYYISKWSRDIGKDKIQSCDFENIPTSYIYRSAKNNRVSKNIMINDIEFTEKQFAILMGWYLSEGSTTKRKDKYNVIQSKISQSKYLDKLIEDFKDMPIKWYIGKDYIGCNDKRITEYLLQFGKSYEKFIPEEIKNMSKDGLEIFINRYMFGDGSFSNENEDIGSIYTSSKKLSEDMIKIIIEAGYGVSISTSKCKGKENKFRNGNYIINHDMIRIGVKKFTHSIIRKNNIKEISYNDYVYDVELPKNHILLVERNGSIYWSGNCRCTYKVVKNQQNSNINDFVPSDYMETKEKLGLENPITSGGVLFNKNHNYFKNG